MWGVQEKLQSRYPRDCVRGVIASDLPLPYRNGFRVQLGEILERQNRDGEARKELEAVSSFYSRSLPVLKLVGVLAVILAMSFFGEWRSSVTAAMVVLGVGSVMFYEKRRGNANDMMQARIRKVLAKICIRAAQFPEADAHLRYCEQVFAICPNWQWLQGARRNRVELLVAQGEFHHAVAIMQEVVSVHLENGGRSHRDTIEAERMLAELAFRSGDRETAEAMLPSLVRVKRQLGAEHRDYRNISAL